jgi:probable rRNA maturation factor
VVLLEHDIDGVRTRALALFAGRARRALRLRQDVSILVTTSEKLCELNRRHRRKNRPTDVLSFLANAPDSAGDIAISAEIAAANARALGHSAETELKILILHGMLHLAGYDHETDNGEMRATESALRSQFKLPVGLIERAHSGGSRRSAMHTRKSISARRRRGR